MYTGPLASSKEIATSTYNASKICKFTFSLTLTGLELKAMPLQKLSALLATVPSLEILIFSPWTLWKSRGGRLLVPPPLEFDLEAGKK